MKRVKMKKIDLSRIISAALAIERVHSLLERYVPQYADLTQEMIARIKRKLRFENMVLDEICRYVGDENLGEHTLTLRDKHEQDHMFSLLEEDCKLIKTTKLPKEFFKAVDEVDAINAFDETAMPPFLNNRGRRLLYTQIVAKTLSKIEEEEVRTDFPMREFFKPIHGFSVPDGLYFMQFKDVPFVTFVMRNHDEDVKAESYELSNRDAFFLFAAKHSEVGAELTEILEKKLNEFNPYASAILTDFNQAYGNTDYRYDEAQTTALRIKKRDPNLSFYNENVKQAFNQDIVPFVQCMSDVGDSRRSYLLAGPPGCGKTQLIKDIVSILPMQFTAIIIDADGIQSLASVNTELDFIKPLCVVIEDIDLIMESGNLRQILLNFLDGISSREQMLTVMTANKPSVLGHVFLRRPGRVDRVIKVLPGGINERIAQLKLLTKDFEVPIELEVLAEKTNGFSFAQHREVVQRARLYSRGKILDKAQTLCAFEECREQFTTDLEDWGEYIVRPIPEEIPTMKGFSS